MSGGLKSFVTEAEADEIKKKRQEEWEKVRKPDDPLERPEEEVDNRTLYEKLQEQKDKKQEEWEEQHKLKNLIRGLDNDETAFLDLVSQQQAELDSRRFAEDSLEIKNYRSAVSELHDTVLSNKPAESNVQKVVKKPSTLHTGKKSQQQLIAGAIKRRKSSGSGDANITQDKKQKTDNTSKEHQDRQKETAEKTNNRTEFNLAHTAAGADEERSRTPSSEHRTDKPQTLSERGKVPTPKLSALSGLAQYSDSSDSEGD